eukprot:COSAG01_NODE_1981_length_8734_cov_7.301563_10_plen_91_part_01
MQAADAERQSISMLHETLQKQSKRDAAVINDLLTKMNELERDHEAVMEAQKAAWEIDRWHHRSMTKCWLSWQSRWSQTVHRRLLLGRAVRR